MIEPSNIELAELPETSMQYIADLEQQNDELMASNERLIAAIRYSTDYLDDNKLNSIGSGSKAHNEMLDALSQSPQTSLAEHDAGVVEKMINEFLGGNKNSWMTVGEMLEYASQLRNQSKENESE